MQVMNVLYPIISFLVHGLEFGLYMYSIVGQTSSDTIDPAHMNNGPPWFITKSCSVTRLASNVGFCKQAKAAFYATLFVT